MKANDGKIDWNSNQVQESQKESFLFQWYDASSEWMSELFIVKQSCEFLDTKATKLTQ